MAWIIALISCLSGSQGFAQQAATPIQAAQQAPDTEFKFNGEFRVRYEADRSADARRENPGGQREDDTEIHHRIKLNGLVRRGESLQAGVTLINAALWGQQPATGDNSVSDTNASGISGSRDGIGTNDNMILVNRAWGWWKATDSLSFKFGRLPLEIADGSVFSENDWEQFPVSHDGALMMWDAGIGRITFFAIKNNEFGNGFLEYDAERVMYGVSLDVKNIPAFLKIANLHLLQITQDEIPATAATTNTVRENDQRVGLTIGGDDLGFIYKGSGAVGFGRKQGQLAGNNGAYDQSINTWMYDLSFGYGFSSLWNLKFMGGYHSDSGDKDPADGKSQQYDPLYYDRHDNAGLMDVLRWGNLTDYSLAALISPRDDIDAGLTYHFFQRTEVLGTTTYGERYVRAGLAAPGPVSSDLGSEFDLFGNKSFDSDNFKLGARLSMFIPGEAIQNATSPRSSTNIFELFGQASMSF